MADGFAPIPIVQEGGMSLVSAEYANKIIIPLNAILSGVVAPIANVGSFKYAGGQFILDLSVLDSRLRRLEGGTVASLAANVAAIEARLNSANISGSGTCSGNNITINVSLNI